MKTTSKYISAAVLTLLCTVMAMFFTACDTGSVISSGKTPIAKPTLTADLFEYNGSPHTVTLSAVSSVYTLGGDVTKTDIGNYTATVTFNDTVKYEWADGTTAPLNLAWKITGTNIAGEPCPDCGVNPCECAEEGDPGCIHEWGEGWHITIHPTCIAEGSQKRECLVPGCGRVEVMELAINSDAHSWIDNWVIIDEATETNAGLKKRYCGNGCGEYQELVIPATACDHQWSEWEETTASTCAAKGTATRTCSECGGEETKEIPIDENAHKWINNWTVTTPPTCAALGTRTRACANSCGATENLSDVPIDDDAHNYIWVQTVPPTCTEDGIETGICSHNSSHITTRKADALGHDYSVPQAGQAETCTEDGYTAYYKCSRCDSLTGKITIPKDPALHIYGPDDKCTVCGTPRPFTTIEAVEAYLAANTGTLAEPLSLPVNFDLGDFTSGTNLDTGWNDLMRAIYYAGDYVHLDLSLCTMSGTEFKITGDGFVSLVQDKIVSLVLPDAAKSIAAGNNNWPHIGGDSFKNLKSISAAEVTSIGDYAFGNYITPSRALSSLTSVNFPKVTSIGMCAFAGCTGLTSVSFPDAPTLGVRAFMSCTNLTSVIIRADAGIFTVFANCPKLTNFTLTGTGPLSTIEGGKILIRNGTELAAYPSASGNITINTLTSIGISTFANNTGLTGAYFPAVTEIGISAFFECTGLSSVDFPAAEIIGANVFYGCTGLRTVSIPAAKSIGGTAFANTSDNIYSANNINSITIAGSIPSEDFSADGHSARMASFRSYYYSTGAQRAGTYTYSASWTLTGTAPEAPSGLTAVAVSSSSISLSWTGSSGATSYRIDRSVSSDSGFATVATVSETTYTDTGLEGNTTYYYRVYAVNNSGTSAAYASANETTQAATVRDPSLVGTWQAGSVIYIFNGDGTTSFAGYSMYTWRTDDGDIILSYFGEDSAPVSYSIEGTTLSLGGNGAILQPGTYVKQ